MERKKKQTTTKNGKRENLQVWISLTEVDSSHAIYFPPTPGVPFCAHIAERHVMVAISVNQRIQESQALRDPHGGVREWKTHQSSTFRATKEIIPWWSTPISGNYGFTDVALIFCWSMSQLCSHSWLKDGNGNPLFETNSLTFWDVV